MSNLAEVKPSYEGWNEILRETPPLRPEQQPLGIIDHLKEQFGDYSDPMTYDWTWRETD
jgi:hypothetical protein